MKFKYIGLGFLALGVLAIPASWAASPLVQAMETSLNLDANFMHTQYHENLSPGDDESGLTPGFTISASALVPNPTIISPDLYTYLGYEFNAGNISYNGHFQDGTPTTATDNTTLNRIEARIGAGFPLQNGAEIIPFLAGGYQDWHRNINQRGVIGTDEFYHSGSIGFGVKLDVPVSPTIVVYGTGEILALVGGGITANGQDFGRAFGPTPEERLELGLDDAISPRWHIHGAAWLEHFNYSGTHPQFYPFLGYYIYEPFSTTTQFGMNLGVSYSFF